MEKPRLLHGKIMVSDNDRHVIAFGCDPESNLGTQDPLLIRFSDQESLTEWNALPTNTAGELRIGSGSEIVQAVETRQQILVFTDSITTRHAVSRTAVYLWFANDFRGDHNPWSDGCCCC